MGHQGWPLNLVQHIANAPGVYPSSAGPPGHESHDIVSGIMKVFFPQSRNFRGRCIDMSKEITKRLA